MKKIILVLFLFLTCYIIYFIYHITEDNTTNIMSIGDKIALDDYLINDNYNTLFVDNDYRIKDILDILIYNKEIDNVSIHQLLKKTDILIISVGMNDIYSKLNDNKKEIYSYLNNMLNDYEEVLKQISKYDYKKVYILGYYNISNQNNDLYTYINYKHKKLVNNYNYTYIDLNNIFNNNSKYLIKLDNYYLNKAGIEQIHKLIVEKL